MNNNDLISRSEVRKMIEKKKKFYKKLSEDYKDEVGHQADLKLGCLGELLSELDNLSGVNGWVEIKPGDSDTEPNPDDTILVCHKGFNGIKIVREALADCQRDGKTMEYLDGRLKPIEHVTHWMPLPPHP